MRLTAFVLLCTSVAFAGPAPKPSVICSGQPVPAGMPFMASLMTPLKSDKTQVGDVVEMVVTEDVKSQDKQLWLSKNTRMKARVVSVVPYAKGSVARLSLRGASVLCGTEERTMDAYMTGVPGTLEMEASTTAGGTTNPYAELYPEATRTANAADTCGEGKGSMGNKSDVCFWKSGGMHFKPMKEFDIQQSEDEKIGTEIIGKRGNIELRKETVLKLRTM